MSESTECMGVIKFGWSDEYVMPMEDASAIMIHFQNAKKLEDKDGIPTLRPVDKYPQFRLMPMTTFKQIKVNDLLDMG